MQQFRDDPTEVIRAMNSIIGIRSGTEWRNCREVMEAYNVSDLDLGTTRDGDSGKIQSRGNIARRMEGCAKHGAESWPEFGDTWTEQAIQKQ